MRSGRLGRDEPHLPAGEGRGGQAGVAQGQRGVHQQGLVVTHLGVLQHPNF